MHHPTDRIAHTTAFVTPVVEHWLEREIAQWVHPMMEARSRFQFRNNGIKIERNIETNYCTDNIRHIQKNLFTWSSQDRTGQETIWLSFTSEFYPVLDSTGTVCAFSTIKQITKQCSHLYKTTTRTKTFRPNPRKITNNKNNNESNYIQLRQPTNGLVVIHL